MILGIDICDDYSQISCFNRVRMDAEAVGLTEDENSCLIPSAVCKERESDKWLTGQDAYGCALQGMGTMVDKPVKMLSRQGTATIGGARYTAEDLVTVLVSQLLGIAQERYHEEAVDQLVFTVPHKEPVVVESLVHVAERLGVSRDKVQVLSHAEAFLFYVLSQKKEIWANEACLFDLADNRLCYYEMDIIRGRSPKVARVRSEELEDGFSLGILETEAGRRLGDKILTSCAERLLNRKIVSAVFLTGKGFEKTDWAENALRLICSKRRVFVGQNLFARGAAFFSYDRLTQAGAFPFICLCEGRVPANISLKVELEGRERQLVLVAGGSNWCDARASVDLILDDIRVLDLVVTSVENPVARHFTIPLEELPKRPNKATRVEVIVSFSGDDQMTVRVIDKGFGDLYPASDIMIRKDFHL